MISLITVNSHKWSLACICFLCLLWLRYFIFFSWSLYCKGKKNSRFHSLRRLDEHPLSYPTATNNCDHYLWQPPNGLSDCLLVPPWIIPTNQQTTMLWPLSLATTHWPLWLSTTSTLEYSNQPIYKPPCLYWKGCFVIISLLFKVKNWILL